MSGHHFDSSSQYCIGCDIGMSAVVNGQPHRKADRDPRIDACPATCQLINDPNAGIFAVITAPDRLVITSGGGVILRLDADAASALVRVAGEHHG